MIRALAALLMAVPAVAQQPGLEAWVYPAGVIGMVRGAVPLSGAWTLEAAAGANVTDRGDWGVHLRESGWGPGGGLGVRWAPRPRGPWVGARAELWALAIDWADLPTQPQGITHVLVFQPGVRAGWRWRPAALLVDLMLAFGREINLRTSGQPVGEGWIALAGVSVAWGR